MKAFTWLLVAVAISCKAPPSSSTRTETNAARAALPLMRKDVRYACEQAVGRLRGTGAHAAVRDTLLDSSEYAPEEMACVVQADSLPPTIRGDLLQTVPLDSGWSWHSFEPVDNPTYGIQRDSVQCEVTPLAGHGSQVGQGARKYAVSLHILCYPN